MEDLRQTTIDTYNKSARALAEYFTGIGARTDNIDLAFELADNQDNPNVLEIGCGDGRDAKEICRRTSRYLGTDISEELIKIAQQALPEGKFKVEDASNMEFPKDLDIVFAFASLLHLNKSELRTVFKGVAKALNQGGIFYISTKYKPEYSQELKEDRFGRRLFYYYNEQIMTELAGQDYEVARTWRVKHGNTDWFELVLRRI